MATPTKIQKFEGQTVGTAITPANSAGAGSDAVTLVDKGSGTLMNYDNTVRMHGTQSLKVTPSGSVNGPANVRYGSIGTPTFAVWGYFYYTTNVGTDAFIRINNVGGTRVGTFQFNGLGKLLFIRNNNQTAWTSTADVPANNFIRYEIYLAPNATTAANGVFKVAFFMGDSTTPIDSFNGTGDIGTTNLNEVYYGRAYSNMQTNIFYIDTIGYVAGASDLNGPYVSEQVVNIDDGVGITDTSDVQRTDIEEFTTEQLMMSDQSAVVADRVRTQADNVGMTDSLSVIWDRAQQISDGVGTTDVTSTVADHKENLNESVGLADNVLSDRSSTGTASQSDQAPVSDLVTAQADRVRQSDDPVVLSDQVTPVAVRVRGVADGSYITDGITVLWDRARGPADVMAIVDTPGKTMSKVVGINDGIGIFEGLLKEYFQNTPHGIYFRSGANLVSVQIMIKVDGVLVPFDLEVE